MIDLKYYPQKKEYTCGPAVLSMVFHFFGKNITEEKLAKIAKTSKEGTTHKNMINTARKTGFYCIAHNKATITQIKYFIKKHIPVIVNYKEPDTEDGHYAVIIGYDDENLFMNDPWNGKRFKIKIKEFQKRWHDNMKRDEYKRWFLIISKIKLNEKIGKIYNPV